MRPHSDRAAGRNVETLPCRTDPQNEDLVLVRQLLARNELAWKEFISRFRRLILQRIHATARELNVIILHADTVEDVCADVFCGLMSRDMDSLRRFEGRSRLSTWLAVVVRRIAIRSLTRRPGQVRQPDTGELDLIPLAADEATSDSPQTRQQLAAAMRQLSADDRTILKLYYEHQQSYAQIGQAFGISENAVGPKLNRARTRLRKLMQRGEQDDSLDDTP